MGAAVAELVGRKGGSGKPKTPVESPDSLRSVSKAKMLFAVGEGEFDGVPTNHDIYLDGTPLAGPDGTLNFPGVSWEWRAGSVDQAYIPGLPATENETTVNVELRGDTPWVRSVSNTQLSAVRLRFAWPALQQQDSAGNVGGYTIDYAVDVATDGGAYQEVLREAVSGKTTTRYERSRRIDLPAAKVGWQIRVRRLTANQNNNRVADTMLVSGFTEVIDAKLRYPNTAVLYIEFSAEQFSNIPQVTVETRARKVQVPSNYDPQTRTYNGIWDGTFKSAWTNNPAWITFDVATNDRFGLGKRIKPWMVDRWELYRIGQYCDQLVPDGLGGQEPRYLCDLNLQSRAGAWELLRDISAIYRGMTYWARGQLNVQADIPREADFDFAFTRANVIDGRFTYSSASERTHYSRALVSYDNPANHYDTDVIPVTDRQLQRRYGDNPIELAAIGCTRASEAQRRGKWVLFTNDQDRVVTFRVGMDGAIPLPGYVIPVADTLLAGREVGGRISAVKGRTVTLDRDTQAKAGDRLILNLPSGKCEARTVRSVAGRAVTVTVAYSEAPERELVWALDADDLAIPLYRVMRVSQVERGIYEISALQYEPSKFLAIDTGAKLETRPISVVPVGVIDAPAEVLLSTFWVLEQGIAVSTMTIAYPAVRGAVAYDIEWRRDNGNWVRLPRSGALSVDVVGVYAGQYLARVRAVSAMDVTSNWRTSVLTQIDGKTEPPPVLTYLKAEPLVFGIQLKWGFPEGASDTLLTELRYGSTRDFSRATALGLHAYPTSTFTLNGLAAAQRLYFWGRLVDKSGNEGAWLGPVDGASSADAREILGYLTGKITETELGKALLSEIEKISGNGAGSVNERLHFADNALQGQIDALGAQVAEIVGAADWSASTSYLKGALVKLDGKLYRALQDVPAGTPVSNATYWELLGDYSSLGDMVLALAVRIDNVETEVSEIDGQLTAMASRMIGVEAQVLPRMAGSTDWKAGDAGVRAASWTVYSAMAAGDRAVSARLDTVQASVGANTAAIRSASEAVADLEGNVSALHTIKTQTTVNGRTVMAGLAIGVEGQEQESQILAFAQRFAILDQNGDGTMFSPFTVQGGQVFMDSAVLRQADIINLIITGVLQSGNYIPGRQGIRINFVTGELEFNGSVPGQGRFMVNNRLMQFLDPNDQLIFRAGSWG